MIAEFPTTFEAAEASRKHGMNVLMGAPNIVRGGSHSGNVAASELAQLGLLDILFRLLPRQPARCGISRR